MARTSSVEKRIAAILSETRERRPPSKRTVTFLLVATLGTLFGSVLLNPLAGRDTSRVIAQDAATSDADADVGGAEGLTPTLHASGQVVDAEGVPVPNVLIVLPHLSASDPKKPRTHRTDNEGRFQLDIQSNPLDLVLLHAWFYGEGYSLRVAAMQAAHREKSGPAQLRIPLPDFQRTKLKVLKPDGSPCSGAAVRPYHIEIPNGTFMADESTGLSMFPPEELWDELGSTSDNDGIAFINAVPRKLIQTVLVESQEFGQQLFSLPNLPLAETNTLQLTAVGSIKGRVITDAPEQLTGIKLTVGTDGNDNTRIPEGIATTELDSNGEFYVPKISAWPNLQLTFWWDQTLDIQPVRDISVGVEAGTTLELDIPTKQVVKISGQVLTEDTRSPVPRARLSFRSPNELVGGVRTITDDKGMYTARVLPGTVKRQLFAVGDTKFAAKYDYPQLDPVEVSADSEKIDADPIYLPPKQVVSGRLQDNSGNPIRGAKVGLHSGRFLKGQGVTDGDGRFQAVLTNWSPSERHFAKDFYWVIIESEANGALAPEYTRVEVLSEDPDDLLLQK